VSDHSDHSDQEASQSAGFGTDKGEAPRTFLLSPGGTRREVDRRTRRIYQVDSQTRKRIDGQQGVSQNSFVKTGPGKFKGDTPRDKKWQIGQGTLNRVITGGKDGEKSEGKGWKLEGPHLPPLSRKEVGSIGHMEQTAQTERVILGSPTQGSTDEYRQDDLEKDIPFIQRIMKKREEKGREAIQLEGKDIGNARLLGINVKGYPNLMDNAASKREKDAASRREKYDAKSRREKYNAKKGKKKEHGRDGDE
jgi:hypothetical protein